MLLNNALAWTAQMSQAENVPSLDDPYHLQRFVDAQDATLGAQSSMYSVALAELRDGSKRSHWMWFIFPQIKGLGSSKAAETFAITSRREAEAYLNHPILGPRLRECTRLVIFASAASIKQIFSYSDDRKFLSSMTLFSIATGEDDVFRQALQKYFSDEACQFTVEHVDQ